jgi:hypothetical protein
VHKVVITYGMRSRFPTSRYAAHGAWTMRHPPPSWVLRTAIGSASMAEQLAVRSTRAQHLAVYGER